MNPGNWQISIENDSEHPTGLRKPFKRQPDFDIDGKRAWGATFGITLVRDINTDKAPQAVYRRQPFRFNFL